MPQLTPVYAFPYPCPGEVVDAADIAALALAIDTKANDVNNDMLNALRRRNFDDGPGTIQTIPAGVDTVLTNTGSGYTITIAGVYVVGMKVTQTGVVPTVNNMRLSVRQNGVVRFRHSQNTETNIPITPHAVGPMICAPGDVISGQFLYNGATTMDVITRISAKMLVRIA